VGVISYGSLCTGYDGLGLALQLAGVPIRRCWSAENDGAMSLVLKTEHPDVSNVGDIKTAPWHLAPHTDLMSSGDPCQAISIAGRQAGRSDPRFLWPWVRDAYRLVRPGGIFFENVANIVSHDDGRTMAERFEHLRADGYAVRWTVLGACAVGAPHHRHRWYAVAAYVGPGAPEAVRVGKKAICGAPRSGGRYLLPSPMARDADGRGEGSPEYWAQRSERRNNGVPLGAVVNLLPTPRTTDTNGPGRTAALQGGDDLRTVISLLPTPKATDGSNGGPNQRDGAGNFYLPGIANLLPTPTTSNAHGNDVNNRGELLLPGVVARPEVWGKYAEAVALWETVTGVPAPGPTEVSPKGSRRLSPLLPEWMMGLRPGLLTDRLERADALRGAGNGVVPLAAAAAWKLLTSGKADTCLP
jgi:DNA (cytosine-5)-methyltransferase 1